MKNKTLRAHQPIRETGRSRSFRDFRRKIRGTLAYPAVLGMMFVLGGPNAILNAQSSAQQFVPFKDFLASAVAASAIDYVGQPTNRVESIADFETMRRHVLTMYEGVLVNHSFVLDTSYFDCIPIEQQPTVRILGLKSIAPPPPESIDGAPRTLGGDADGPPVSSASQLDDPDNTFDHFGNSLVCETGTIPMRRITLEEMTRFPTLQQYFWKAPHEAVPFTHKYSYTTQLVDNLGGSSALNIWSPNVNTSAGEVFSLSQEWYVGGSGTTLPGKQTAEVGWQNYPTKYGSQDSRLFIYWTADGYNTTGCYNLDCAGFVQVADTGYLGAAFANYSTLGGTQYEFVATYRLFEGNWWLNFDGTWIGYYPTSIYQGGQLASNATTIQFGTEGVGIALWPPEGSGDWSSMGFGYAAYQRDLFYTNTSPGHAWDRLTSEQPSPACYSISGPYSSASSGWTVYFYEGGPGGSGC